MKKDFDKLKDLSREPNKEFNLPLVNAKFGDNGIMYYARPQDFESVEMSIDIVKNGAISTGTVYPQPQKTGVFWDAYLIKAHAPTTQNLLCFYAATLQKSIQLKFSYENKAGWAKVKKESIQLPVNDRKIDYEFMESFISELENEQLSKLDVYLSATGLKDYKLTPKEQKALDEYKQAGKCPKKYFFFKDIFDQIKQGRRLKKDDQIPGSIPFVMSGVKDTGIVNSISNPIATFPKNSITVDIFGNTFYRNYDFGAGDDTGVYWNNANVYTKEIMLFFAGAIQKSLNGKFSFGHKLRSSQSLDFKLALPTQNGKIDYDAMSILISAIQKLVIKDVVLYAKERSPSLPTSMKPEGKSC